MLKLAYFKDHWFPPFRVNGGIKGFNEFVKTHPPANSKNQPGINMNTERGAVFLFYEVGEPNSPHEQIAALKQNIRDKKFERLLSEPLYRVKLREKGEVRTKLAELEMQRRALEESTTKEDRQKLRELADHIKQGETTLEAIEQFLVVSKGNEKNIESQIEAMKSVISDIERGTFSI